MDSVEKLIQQIEEEIEEMEEDFDFDKSASRKEEVDFIESRNQWELRPISECIAVTGKPPIAMRWVDTDKGFMTGEHNVRCRMVAKDFKGKDKGRDDLFAETPPLEAKRMLLSRAVPEEEMEDRGN
eukprot:2878905-Karenia_brevis.AAC.1